MEAELFLKADPQEYYAAFLKEQIRPDGRTLAEARTVAIQLGVRGPQSAVVRLGNTAVMCWVETAAKVSLTITGASDPGLSSFLPSLAVEGATHIQVIQEDGNLVEAALLCYQFALLAPLQSADSARLETMNFAFTFCDVQKHLLRDPVREESALADGELTILCSGDCRRVLPVKRSGKPVALSDICLLC